MAGKKNRTASNMYPLMTEYKSFGKGQKIFCKEKGIAYSVFQYWLTKYNDAQKGGAARSQFALLKFQQVYRIDRKIQTDETEPEKRGINPGEWMETALMRMPEQPPDWL